MDDFYTLIHHLPRRTPHPIMVHSLGYFRRKHHATAVHFRSSALSLILAGGGRFACDGQSYPVPVPAALWEPAGSSLRYGPEPWWEEFFVVWSANDTVALRTAGLFDPAALVRPLPPRAQVWPLCERLARLCRRPETNGAADRIDLLAHQLAAEISLHDLPLAEDETLAPIRSVQARIDADPVASPGPAALARMLGLHPQTFARRWARAVGGSPLRYIQRARLGLACRLLAETELPVAAIGERCGFSDPLYFSRRFRREIGETASAWRAAHRRC